MNKIEHSDLSPPGLVKMILRQNGFNSAEEVRAAVKQVCAMPNVVPNAKKRKSSIERKARALERALEDQRQKELINGHNSNVTS